MSKQITLRSLAELDQWYGIQADDEPRAETPAAAEGSPVSGESADVEEGASAAGTCAAEAVPTDLEALVADLASAEDALGRIRRDDEEARASARDQLERYDVLAAASAAAERALIRARAVREQAEALADGAFAEGARGAARRVADRAAAAEAQAAHGLEARRAEAARFAAEHDLERLLEERRQAEEAERARAARVAKAERLADALAAAKELVAASQLKEARELLGTATNENPGSPEIASLLGMIAQKELEDKTFAAEDALWRARFEWERNPGAAVERLAALDVAGLPRPLGGDLFVCWIRACARLCADQRFLEPLCYRPALGRGAVVARTASGGPYLVVSALGMPSDVRPGSPAPPGLVGQARPLWWSDREVIRRRRSPPVDTATDAPTTHTV